MNNSFHFTFDDVSFSRAEKAFISYILVYAEYIGITFINGFYQKNSRYNFNYQGKLVSSLDNVIFIEQFSEFINKGKSSEGMTTETHNRLFRNCDPKIETISSRIEGQPELCLANFYERIIILNSMGYIF